MSLEDAIKENTAAVRELILALRAGTPASKGDIKAVAEAPYGAAEVKKSTGSAKESEGSAASSDTGESTQELNYAEDVRKPFLALLNSKRDAAMKVLADLGVANLKGFEDKPETFADLANRIKEAQNG